MKTNLLKYMVTHFAVLAKEAYVSIKTHVQEVANTAAGGVIGYVSPSVYDTWLHPIALSAACALVSLIVTVVGKKILKKLGLYE